MGDRETVEDRFLRRVNKTETCWLWTGMTAGQGRHYGSFNPTTSHEEPNRYAHRIAYEMWVGPIPDGLEIDHLCRVKLCVRPDHLEPVTHQENMRRARLEVCRSGLHDLTDPANQQWDDQGRRRGCLQCHRAKARARYTPVKVDRRRKENR